MQVMNQLLSFPASGFKLSRHQQLPSAHQVHLPDAMFKILISSGIEVVYILAIEEGINAIEI